MNWTKRRERFRASLAGPRCHHPASVFDPLSGRIAEMLGYEVAVMSGSDAALAILGGPDLTLMTLSEFAEQALRINRACELPLVVDADHGYGNAFNVMRTIQELETAGVAAIEIEDTLLPRPYGPSDKPQLLSIEEGVGKIKAALAARQDSDLVISGRTGAMRITGIEDTIARARAYQAVGADAMFVGGIKTREELERISGAIDIPLFMGSNPLGQDLPLLGTNRVRVCIQGHHAMTAAIQAMHDALKALRDGATPAKIERVASEEYIGRLTREAEYEHATKEFLGGA